MLFVNFTEDGNGALGFEVGNTKEIGEVQVVIGGQPAISTSVQEKVVTAAFPPAPFAQAGEKEVMILRQTATGRQFVVGRLTIK